MRSSLPGDLRISLITPGFSADDRDWGIPALRHLTTELARRAEVRILALHYPYRRSSYRVAGAEVHALGGSNARGIRRGWLMLRALVSILEEQRRSPTHVLHAFWADESGAVAVAAGALLRVPAVVSVAGGELVSFPDIGYGGMSRLSRQLLPHTLRRAARVTVGSATLELLAAPRVPSGRLVRLPLGVDTGLFAPGRSRAPGPLVEGSVRLLSVGSLSPVKDHRTLLRAFASVAGRVPGTHLHIVGDGPLKSTLAAQAEGLGVSPRVTFHGAVPHEQLPTYYRAADLVVLASRYESQAMVALEAAACGSPVAGTAVGVLPELPGAHVAPMGDPAALAETITIALSDRDALGADSRLGLEAVRADFALERVVDRLCSLYREVLSV